MTNQLLEDAQQDASGRQPNHAKKRAPAFTITALEPRILRSATALETVETEQPVEGSPVDLAGVEHDVHHGTSGDDVLRGTDGHDWMDGHAGDDVLHGEGGHDLLYGGKGNDQLFAGDGDDVLHGGAGADHLHGGDGHDTASYLESDRGVRVNLSTGLGSKGDAAGDRLDGIEAVHGSDHRDTLIGDRHDNELFGHDGNDRLKGGGGDDLISGGDGKDTAYFSGKASDYEIEHHGDHHFTVHDLRGIDGTDTVDSVETFHFADGKVAADKFVNHAPTDLTLAGSEVAENSDEGALVGHVTVKDVDAHDSHTFALLNDAGGRFTIDHETGDIHVAHGADLNFEAAKSHTVDVQVTDAHGATYHEKFTIGVTDVNEAPYDLALKGDTVSENAKAGTVVGTVSVKDSDAGDRFTYSLTDNADGLFTIDAKSGAIKVAKGAVLDFESSPEHHVTVQVKDSAGHTYDESFAIHLKNVNEKPTDLLLEGGSVNENATAGTVVGKVTGMDPDDGDTLTYSLTNSAGGKFAIDAKTGEITVAKGAKLDFESGESPSITVRVKDAGGKYYDESFKIAVQDFNEAPTDLTLKGGSVNENSAPGTVVGQLSVKDPDRGDTHTYSLVNDAGGRFTVDAATGEIKVAEGSKLDYESSKSHSVTVRVQDSGGLTYDEAFKINVSNVNEAPTDLTLKGGAVNENAKAGTVVGTVSAKDADKGEKFSYSLADDADGRFTIDAKSGRIKVASGAILDYESDPDHVVKVQVKDSAGNAYSEEFQIQLKNVNEAPTDLTLDGGKVGEHATPGTVVGKVTGVDPDAGDKLTYSLTNSAGGNFAINAKTGEITVAKGAKFDYEPGDQPTITVRVKDAGGKYYDESFKIDITGDGDGGNLPPTDLTLTGDTVDENAAAGTVVGRVSATDPDHADTFTYALTDDAGGRFTIDAATGEVRVASGADLNFEGQSQHAVTVQVTDSAGHSYSETLDIQVRDVNEAPIDLTLNGDTIDENSAAGTVVGRAVAADQDQGDTFTYALTDDAGGRFTIDAATGEVRVASGADLNFETQSEHSVTVQVTDAAGNSFTEALDIQVRDVNEAPTGLTLEVGSVNENSAPGTVVGKATIVDPDQADTITYSLVDNAQGRFTIDPTTGEILVAEPTEEVINYEDNTQHQITVRATDAAGNAIEQTVAIQVNNVNEWVNSVDDYVEGVEDQPIVTPNVLENDYDIDGDAISVSSYGPPQHGAVVYNGDGTFTYTPNPNFSGSDSFTYTVTDGNGMFSTSTVHIQVHGDADAGTLEVADATLYEGQTAPLSISAALSDLDGSEAMTIRIENVPAGASLSAGSYQGNGVWTLSAADLEGLQISLPQNAPAEVTLKVTLLTTEADGDQVAITRDLALHVSGFQLESDLNQPQPAVELDAPVEAAGAAVDGTAASSGDRPTWPMLPTISSVDPNAAELLFSELQLGEPGAESAWSGVTSHLEAQTHDLHGAADEHHHGGEQEQAPGVALMEESPHHAAHHAAPAPSAGWLQQVSDRFSWIWGMFWAYGGTRGAGPDDAADQRNLAGK